MKTVIGFLSRAHGLAVLSALVKSQNYKLLRIYTHMFNPKSQDPNRSIRQDYNLFVKECTDNNIELISIDSKCEKILDFPDCDFIVEVSWRYLIPDHIVSKAKIGAFGIHRGKLPDYAGSEPIKQALLKGDNEIVLSAHNLSPKIDYGETISFITHPVNYDSNSTLEENIQRLRDEITPLFPKITLKTLECLYRK